MSNEKDIFILSLPKLSFTQYMQEYYAAIQSKDFYSAFFFLTLAKKYYPNSDHQLMSLEDMIRRQLTEDEIARIEREVRRK